jgi:hypothetical protein
MVAPGLSRMNPRIAQCACRGGAFVKKLPLFDNLMGARCVVASLHRDTRRGVFLPCHDTHGINAILLDADLIPHLGLCA